VVPPGLIDSPLPIPPTPEEDRSIRTGDFIDNNNNGVDDRDEKPGIERPRGPSFIDLIGTVDPNSDIGRLIARLRKDVGAKPGGPSRGGTKGSDVSISTPPSGVGGIPIYTPPPISSTPPPTYDIGIPVTDIPTPGYIANPLPVPPGAGTSTPYFTPTPGGLTPGTIPTSMDLPSLRTSDVPFQAIGANPNLSPTVLGGAENLGYYTDRFGNIILSPGAVRPPGYAEGGNVTLEDLLKGEAKEKYKDSIKNFESARALLNALKLGEGTSTTEFSSTPLSQTVKRTTKRPIEKKTDKGTAKGMAMELESLTTAQGPERAPDTLAELLKMSENVRARDAMSAKDLLRNTFGTETLSKKQLSRLGDLMTRRFAEGGDVKRGRRRGA